MIKEIASTNLHRVLTVESFDEDKQMVMYTKDEYPLYFTPDAINDLIFFLVYALEKIDEPVKVFRRNQLTPEQVQKILEFGVSNKEFKGEGKKK